MTPEQAARLALDIGREVTALVERKLAEMAKWGPTPAVREDEQPVGTFGLWSPGEAAAKWPAPGVYHASDCAVHNEPYQPNGPCDCGAESGDGGVAEDAKRLLRGQEPIQSRPDDEDDCA